MKDRLVSVREKLKLSQKNFGEKIFLSQNMIGRYERGETNPDERTIALICDKFNVSEEWLRTGNGEMFKQPEYRDITMREHINYQLKKLNDVEIAFIEHEIDNLIAKKKALENVKFD